MLVKSRFMLDVIKTTSEEKRSKGTIIFVHGVCHSAWCWLENYAPFFADNGWNSYALSLRGHGQSQGRDQLDQFGLSDYVSDVLSVVNELEEPPIVIGHSMGGAITQLLMTQFPEKIAGAVLLASMPPGTPDPWERLRLLRYPTGVLALFRLINQKPVSASGVAKSPFFSNRISKEKASGYLEHLQTESRRALSELSKFQTAGGAQPFPLLVLGSRQDLIFGNGAIERTAKHYKTQATVLREGCHDLMLDPMWEQSAHCILDWLNSSF
ncbi:alpha/beta hydrolase [Pseudomonas sp. NFX224]|uniref:alpha/beta hydrolase n=1 Tax=Pseudomonas sp. NFX224 TaxID=3402862 RepID=UPI003AFAAC47